MIYNQEFNYKTTNKHKPRWMWTRGGKKHSTQNKTTTNEEVRRDAKQTSKCASILQA